MGGRGAAELHRDRAAAHVVGQHELRRRLEHRHLDGKTAPTWLRDCASGSGVKSDALRLCKIQDFCVCCRMLASTRLTACSSNGGTDATASRHIKIRARLTPNFAARIEAIS
jgi:hypothetical protein